MNRKQWIITGIIFIFLFFTGVVVLLNRRPNDTARTVQDVPVLKLAYCSEENSKPCVVSFSMDADNNMLVNILLPELSYPGFYLKIEHSGTEIKYTCQRIREAINNAYCTGERLPPGEPLRLMLISIRDGILLAEGKLSIIGLAYPTMGVVTPTPTATATPSATPTPNVTITPSATLTPRVTSTLTKKPSYPNPSYP